MVKMVKVCAVRFINIPADVEAALIAGARDSSPVEGLTHSYYKYPARFSPSFARAVIEAFSAPGDLCLDPHVGGGTTLVEALALGRRGIGVDVSALAEFVATVKTTVFSVKEIEILRAWAECFVSDIDLAKDSRGISKYEELGYYKHLKHPSRWRLRKAIEQALTSATSLRDHRLDPNRKCRRCFEGRD